MWITKKKHVRLLANVQRQLDKSKEYCKEYAEDAASLRAELMRLTPNRGKNGRFISKTQK